MNKYDVIIIGAGAGGLVIAIGAAKARKKVLLVEKNLYGGDCTNFGCIPSKTLIAAANTAHHLKTAEHLGLKITPLHVDTSNVLEHVRQIVTEIRTKEEPPVLKTFGIKTLTAHAQFLDAHCLLLDRQKVWGKKIVIATGSRPVIPPLKGLQGVPFLTNETLFDLPSIPKSIIFIGVGPISIELAQALSRLGSKVSVVGRGPVILAREENQAQQVLEKILQKEGLLMYLNSEIEKVSYEQKLFSLAIKEKETHAVKTIEAEALFVGIGREPTLKGLQLDLAGVRWSKQGIAIDSYGRTSQSHIYAVGDAVGAPFFTHRAENQARTVLKNLLLPFKSKISLQPIPRCTYTAPEIASIGLLEKEAQKKYGEKKLAIYHIPFSEVDRNITSGQTEGFVNIITKKWSSKILGATIVGDRAGEMLMQLSTAISAKMPLRRMSHLIHPYPIESLAIRKAADLWLTQTLLPSLKNILRKK